MSRYGYLDMPNGYSDITDWPVRAICPSCGRRHIALAEDVLDNKPQVLEDGALVYLADDLCSEYPGDRPDDRQHEW